MPEANWMASISIPGISVLGASLEVDIAEAMKSNPEDFEQEFIKTLAEKTHELVYRNALLVREETPEGVMVSIQFGFIPDLDEYREQLHEALLKAYNFGFHAGVEGVESVINVGLFDPDIPVPATASGERPKVETVLLPEHPHSRACGVDIHAHGIRCHANCPTCHGKPIYPLTDVKGE